MSRDHCLSHIWLFLLLRVGGYKFMLLFNNDDDDDDDDDL